MILLAKSKTDGGFGRAGPPGAAAARWPHSLCVGVLLLLEAGCASGINLRQAELCRIAAVAVFDPLDLHVLDQRPLAPGDDGPSGVAIDFSTVETGGRIGGRHLECRFSEARSDTAGDLVSVETSSAKLSSPSLFMLKRFWLKSIDSQHADPLISERWRGLPSVPFALAYPLQSLLAALPNAAVYGLLAATYSLVYGLFGRINLAFGEIAAIGSVGALLGAASAASMPAAPILILAGGFALWAAGLHGAVIERLALWRLRRSTGQQGLVATIGLALFLQEYLRIVSGSQPRYIASILSTTIGLVRADDFVVTVTPLSLLVFAVSIAASLGVLALLRFTGFGRAWRATADDPFAASLFGIDPRRLSLQTFVLACSLAGLAGASVTLISGTVGFVYTTTLGLKALIAAIVGGIGSVPGAFLGGLAIAVIEAGWSAYFPIVYRDLVIDGLLVAMLVFRPGGLFGYRDLSPRRV